MLFRKTLPLFVFACMALNSPVQAATTPPNRCIAIRGNGELVSAHWSAMGRLLEEEGLFDGGAGGSSASVTLFLYESILLNPQLRACAGGTRACSEAETALRASLLMKSLIAYLDVVKNDDDYSALIGLGQSLMEEKQRLASAPAGSAVTPAQLSMLLAKVNGVIERPSIRALVNPDFVRFIRDAGPGQQFRLQEAVSGIRTFGNFDANDKAILFRPGILSFSEVADRVGRVGNFYAGRGAFYDAPGMQRFLDRCAPLARGRSWSELAQAQGMQGSCHAEAVVLMKTYRTNLLRTPGGFASRIDDRVGGQGFRALVSLAVVEGPGAMKSLSDEWQAYVSGQGFERARPMQLFDQVGFGYYGGGSDSRIATRKELFSDLKTSKGRALGETSWRVALQRSPAEPGLSAILAGPRAGMATAAGWTDLAPTLVLRNLGCKRVVYLTRMGQDSSFAQGVERLLGATPRQLGDLHSLETASSLQLSIRQADRVYCTNWNNLGQDVFKLERDGYHAGETWGDRRYIGCGGSLPEVK